MSDPCDETSDIIARVREGVFTRSGPKAAPSERPLSADSVEKVEFSARLNSGTAFSGEPTHHIEWFLGPSLTFAALLLG
jgi:hypothetical protein